VGYVGHIGEGEVFREFWLGDPKVRDHWKDLDIVGKITLKWTLVRQGSMGRIGFDWLRIGSIVSTVINLRVP
jgi:hypothetical protein